MNLIYLRIGEGISLPNHLLNKDFNFSCNNKIIYKNQKFAIKKINNKSFFNLNEDGNIYNISAIIGINGSGKSSLLSSIINILYNKKNNLKAYAIGFETENKITIFTKNIKVDNFKEFNNLKIIKIDDTFLDKYFQNNDIATIFLSNSFTWDNYFLKSLPDKNYYNESFDNYIREIPLSQSYNLYNENFIDTRFDNDYISNKKQRNYIRNLSFIANNDYCNINSITLSFSNLKDYKKLRFNKRKTKIESKIYSNIKKCLKVENREEKFYNLILLVLVDMLFNEIYGKCQYPDLVNTIIDYYCSDINYRIKGNYSGYTESILKNILVRLSDLNLNLEKYQNILQKDYLKYNKGEIFNTILKTSKLMDIRKNDIEDYFYCLNRDFRNIANKYLNLLEYFQQITNMCNNYTITENTRYEPELKLIIKKDQFKDLSKIIEYVDNNFSLNPFIIEYKELSAGYHAQLDLYSSINYSIEKIKRRNKINRATTYLLLLDEPDLYFHPKWSRELIYNLINILNKYSDLNFQIIITTNKPYILSDLPKESVLTIGENRIENTFAANIIDLLANNYFLNNYIGEFATKKINKVISNIYEKNISQDNEETISQIGDTVLKSAIKETIKEVNKDVRR